MRNFRSAVAIMGASAAVGVMSSLMVAGCSGDDTTGPDGGDATPDMSMPDSPLPPDTGVDTGGGDADAGPMDGGCAVEDYRQSVAKAFCTRFKNCCTGLDGGTTFDDNLCQKIALANGWQGSNSDLTIPEVTCGPNVQLDNTAAQQCLAGLATLSCPIITSMEFKNLTDSCSGAVTGKLGVGKACIRTSECQKGEYCNFDGVDGGKSDGGNNFGACANLVVQGGLCGQGFYGEPSFASEECAYKGWDTPPLFCKYDSYPDKSKFACSALRTNGATCFFNNECSSGICALTVDGGSCGQGQCQCQATTNFAPLCRDLSIKDAGGG